MTSNPAIILHDFVLPSLQLTSTTLTRRWFSLAQNGYEFVCFGYSCIIIFTKLNQSTLMNISSMRIAVAVRFRKFSLLNISDY